MKTYSCLSDRFHLPDRLKGSDGRWGATFDEFMKLVDAVIMKAAGITSAELGDTVCTHDAWEDGSNPVDVAEDIMAGDTIGEQMLALALGQEVDW